MVSRVYRSSSGPWTSADGYWRFWFDRNLRKDTLSTDIFVFAGDGSVFEMNKISGINEWKVKTNPDTHLRLLKYTTPIESYDLIYPDDTVDHYELKGGRWRPVWIKTRDGYQQNFTYDSNGLVTTITDNLGRSLTVTWTHWIANAPSPEQVNASITSITTPTATIAYAYDFANNGAGKTYYNSRRLTTATLTPIGGGTPEVTTYHYEDPDFRELLTGITDARGIRYATWAYDRRGRAISSSHAGGTDQTTISYNDTTKDRTVTNPLGKVGVFKHSLIKSRLRLTQIDGQASTNCPASAKSWTYDTTGWIATATDEEGRVTKYIRDTRGQPTSITRGFGTPEATTTTITYHATLHIPTQVVEPGLTTNYTWNASGQLTQVSEVDTTTGTIPYSSNGQTRTWVYTYTTAGLLDTVNGPLSGAGDTVNYDYNANGYIDLITNEVGHVTDVTAVNGLGLPTSVTDPNGVVTTMTYDFVGRLKTVTVDPGPNQALTTINYDAIGQVTSSLPAKLLRCLRDDVLAPPQLRRIE